MAASLFHGQPIFFEAALTIKYPEQMRILVVDDQDMQRLIVKRALTKLGHQIYEADSGEKALQVVAEHDIDLIVSDWVMDGMDGAQLCRAIRSRQGVRYVYFILMSSRDTREDLLEGLSAGADDFLRKPIDVDELAVRLRSGHRLLELQANLQEKNNRLDVAYQQIQKDVDDASTFQKGMLPTGDVNDSRARFAWLFIPSMLVSGDGLNYFRLDDNHIGFYNLDVSGHGVASAMVSMMVTQMLNPVFTGCLLWNVDDAGQRGIKDPAALVGELNEQLLKLNFGSTYLTCVYGVLDLRNGELRMVRAGHTLPVIVSGDGVAQPTTDEGDMPVGMFEGANFHNIVVVLQPGSRICFYSDGVTECPDSDGEMFEIERLTNFLEKNFDSEPNNLTLKFAPIIRAWKGIDIPDFLDDVSMLVIEYVSGTGPLPASSKE
jgi:phosphoserine phosphatase RsbU/P